MEQVEMRLPSGWFPSWLKSGITLGVIAGLLWYAASDHQGISNRLTALEAEQQRQQDTNDQVLRELERIENRDTAIITILHHLDPTIPIPDIDSDQFVKPQSLFVAPPQKEAAIQNKEFAY